MSQKGKQATKGQKQIKQENDSTMKFYSTVMIVSYAPVLIMGFIFNKEGFGYRDISLLAFTTVIFGLCFKTMQSMAKSNLDLSMQQGMGEHLKDILLVTAACQMLGAFSMYFWFFWLVIPAVAFYKLWVNILAPWIFQAPVEQTDKQKRKMERKMRR